MKKIMKSRIFIFILKAIMFTSIGVYAATTYKASDVIYNASDGTSMNVNDALNELYNKKIEDETKYYLYKDGDIYSSITGGWRRGYQSQYTTLTNSSGHLTFKATGGNYSSNMTTTNKINLTDYKKIYFEVDNYNIKIGTMTNPDSMSLQRTDYGLTTSLCIASFQYKQLDNGHYLIELSIPYLSGDFYVVLDAYSITVNVYEVYMTK